MTGPACIVPRVGRGCCRPLHVHYVGDEKKTEDHGVALHGDLSQTAAMFAEIIQTFHNGHQQHCEGRPAPNGLLPDKGRHSMLLLNMHDPNEILSKYQQAAPRQMGGEATRPAQGPNSRDVPILPLFGLTPRDKTRVFSARLTGSGVFG
ncbi:hypothetical protein BaRGS_00013518 [Batillaria attramentaria]|uniref:Uncharacterized protein n=1 Tax=Batillaria attramentaria TaxID=370345 RepID=A0ABD0L7W7_9CAEN